MTTVRERTPSKKKKTPHMLGCKHTHKRTQSRALIISSLSFIMRWRTCSASAGMVWLSGCARLALTQSHAPAAPASPPCLRHRQAQRGGPNLGWRGGAGNSALGSIHCDRLRAIVQPHHLNTTKYWHCGGLDSVCVCVCVCVASFKSVKMVLATPSATRNLFLPCPEDHCIIPNNNTKTKSISSSNFVMACASPWQHGLDKRSATASSFYLKVTVLLFNAELLRLTHNAHRRDASAKG